MHILYRLTYIFCVLVLAPPIKSFLGPCLHLVLVGGTFNCIPEITVVAPPTEDLCDELVLSTR